MKKVRAAAVIAAAMVVSKTAVYAENAHNTGVYSISELVTVYNMMKADGPDFATCT